MPQGGTTAHEKEYTGHRRSNGKDRFDTSGSLAMEIAILYAPLRLRIGRRVHAPDPPRAWRRSRLRTRLAARFPPHSKAVGSRFHPRAVASNQSMICSGVVGWCPSRARRFKMRCTDSVMLSQLPPSGVNKGIIPCAKRETHQLRRMVARQVIPDEPHAQWRHLGRARDTHHQPVLPPLPTCPMLIWAEDDWGRQRGQHRGPFFLQPGMEHDLRAPPGPFDPNPPGGRMK